MRFLAPVEFVRLNENMASYQRRTDDLLRLKTRQLILQNVNGTYPGAGSMLYIADSNGTLGNASSITADASGNLSAITLGLQNPETFYRIPTVDPNTVTLPVLANSTNVLINSYNSLLTYLYDRNLINLENADISGESYGSLFATSNVPAGTTLITSSDYGLTWTTVAHNLLLTKIKRFFWNEAVKLWFAVGSNGIQTSGDGISWNPIITGLPNFPFQDIDANNDVMFTGLLGQPGQEQHLWFSYNNGTTWTKTAHATLSVNSIYWDGVRSFMFCLTDGNNRGRVFQSFSNDPKNWYPRGYITTWNSVNDIVDDGYTYVICGEPILGTGSGRKSLSYSYGDNNSWGWIDCSGDLFAEAQMIMDVRGCRSHIMGRFSYAVVTMKRQDGLLSQVRTGLRGLMLTPLRHSRNTVQKSRGLSINLLRWGRIRGQPR